MTCENCKGGGYLYINGTFKGIKCPDCNGTGTITDEVIVAYVETVPGSERCLGGHPVANKERIPWSCAVTNCPYYWPKDGMPAADKKGGMVDTLEPPKKRKLLHKWLGGQSAYFQDRIGTDLLMELLTTIERRRGQ
jgi:hypothetical protein